MPIDWKTDEEGDIVLRIRKESMKSNNNECKTNTKVTLYKRVLKKKQTTKQTDSRSR